MRVTLVVQRNKAPTDASVDAPKSWKYPQVETTLPMALQGVMSEKMYRQFAEELNEKIVELMVPTKKCTRRVNTGHVLGCPLWFLSCGLLFIPYFVSTEVYRDSRKKKMLKALQEHFEGLRNDKRWRALGVAWRLKELPLLRNDRYEKMVPISVYAELSIAAVQRAAHPMCDEDDGTPFPGLEGDSTWIDDEAAQAAVLII
mmetsp:Transcript_2260/g.8054  ORF Transcript_2260/g.8054 Transcript_2260/m.8054 type:complete len:201 (+) Transcript_2260:1-603(+)